MSPSTSGSLTQRPFTSRAWWSDQLRSAWTRPELRWLAAILVLATVLRIIWIVYATGTPGQLQDPFFYLLYGEQIAAGNGYRLLDGQPTAYYPIGYPATIGGVLALVRHTPIPYNPEYSVTSFQVVLGVATVALAYGVGRRLFNPAVGLLAALWLAVFPNIVFHTATFLGETLFNFLVIAALLVLVWDGWQERRLPWWRVFGFGALLGLSILVRPISVLFLPALLLVWLAFGFGWRRSLAYSGAVVGIVVALLVPWNIRNVIVMDPPLRQAPLFLSTNLGDNLCMGHYPGAPGHFALPDVCFSDAPYAGLDRAEFEVRRNDDNTRKALRFIREYPAAEVKLLARKSWWLWRHDHDGLDAVEEYGRDPFITPDFSLQIVPADVPEGLLPAVTADLARLTGGDPQALAARVEQARATDPRAPLVVSEDINRETARELREQTEGLAGVRVVNDSPLRWALGRIADGFYFVSISLGALGLVGLVLRPWDPRRVFFLLALLSLAGIPLVFFGDARFHVPVIPLLVVASAWLVVATVTALPRLVAPPSAAPGPRVERGRTSARVEVAEGEASVPEQDALQDA